MGNIVTAQEVATFLRLTDNDGAIIVPSENSDPSLASLNIIIDGVEGEFDERTFHSWGHYTQVLAETKDLINEYEWGRGIPIHLAHRSVLTIDETQGDKLEVWDGTNWKNISATIGNGFKQLEQLGKVYLLGMTFSIFRDDRIRVTYRYGTLEVNAGIKFAILQRCAVKVMETSIAMSNVEFGQDRGLRTSELLEKWDRDYEDAITRWQDWVRIET